MNKAKRYKKSFKIGNWSEKIKKNLLKKRTIYKFYYILLIIL